MVARKIILFILYTIFRLSSFSLAEDKERIIKLGKLLVVKRQTMMNTFIQIRESRMSGLYKDLSLLRFLLLVEVVFLFISGFVNLWLFISLHLSISLRASNHLLVMSEGLVDSGSSEPVAGSTGGDLGFRIELSFHFGIEGGALDERLQRDWPTWASTLMSQHLKFLLSEYQPENQQVEDPVPVRTSTNLLDRVYNEDRWSVIVPPCSEKTLDHEVMLELQGFASNEDSRKRMISYSRVFEIFLVSPVFALREWHAFINQLRSILCRLNDIHNSPISQEHFICFYSHYAWASQPNHLRVSIVSPEGTHFNQLTLQNLIVIWSRYIKGIESLIPPHRRSEAESDEHDSYPLRPLFNKPITRRAVDEFRSAVYATTDARDLQNIFEPYGPVTPRAKITFRTFRGNTATLCNEVEFGEAAATMQIQDVSFWICFVSAVFRFAEDLAARHLTFDTVHDPSHLIDLLELLNASRQVMDICDVIGFYND